MEKRLFLAIFLSFIVLYFWASTGTKQQRPLFSSPNTEDIVTKRFTEKTKAPLPSIPTAISPDEMAAMPVTAETQAAEEE